MSYMFVPRIRGPMRPAPEHGQGLAEYGLILALVAVVTIVILGVFGQDIRGQYCEIVYSIDPDIDAPLCNTIQVSCIIESYSPFAMSAEVTDEDGGAVDYVNFYVDGNLYNEEDLPKYCLQSGDVWCDAYTGPKGEHRFTAVVFMENGETGQCTLTYDVP